MNHYVRLNFRQKPDVVRVTRSDTRMTIVRTLMMAVLASIVVLAIVAQLRFSPEQRTEPFKSTYAYPAL
jgi:uncharacterized membrane protein affecting hemolysin expression